MAVNGKQLRGSRTGSGKAVCLLAAMDHAGTVIGQRQTDAKSNETPQFILLLEGLDLVSAVVTADAAHTQYANGTWLRDHKAHYIAVVKGNHPTLLVTLKKLPWHKIALDHKDRTTGSRRLEVRRLKTAAFRHLDYPGPRQALQTVRYRKDLTSGKTTIQRLYFVTSLPPGKRTAAGGDTAGRTDYGSQGAACSSCVARESRSPSPPRSAANWTPNGSPSPSWPNGMEKAGMPVTL